MTSQTTLTEDQLRALEIIARSEKRPVDDLIRQAIAEYLEARRGEKQKAVEAGFDAWGPGEDSLAYQGRVRGEW